MTATRHCSVTVPLLLPYREKTFHQPAWRKADQVSGRNINTGAYLPQYPNRILDVPVNIIATANATSVHVEIEYALTCHCHVLWRTSTVTDRRTIELQENPTNMSNAIRVSCGGARAALHGRPSSQEQPMFTIEGDSGSSI